MLSGWRSQDTSVKNRQTFDGNLLYNFYITIYHQTTIEPTKIKEVETVPCYIYKRMRSTKGIANLQKVFTTDFGH